MKSKYIVQIMYIYIFFSPQKFKSLLIQELTKVFPEDMAKYKAIRGEDPPP